MSELVPTLIFVMFLWNVILTIELIRLADLVKKLGKEMGLTIYR